LPFEGIYIRVSGTGQVLRHVFADAGDFRQVGQSDTMSNLQVPLADFIDKKYEHQKIHLMLVSVSAK
jgi:hypothetical protein